MADEAHADGGSCKHCGLAIEWHFPESWVVGRWRHTESGEIKCELRAEPADAEG